ncbi:MAG: NadS family protein [Thermoanaerobaculia bacterium]
MKEQDFEELVRSVKQAGRIKRGQLAQSRRFEFEPEDVRSIRQEIGLSQSEFALLIGVSVSTLQNWEQGRRRPEGPARALLRIAATKPRALLEALRS